MAMVGGGIGSFIGKVHRAAARFNGDVEFVAGAVSSDPARSREQGVQLGLDPARAYGTWQEMVAGESALPAGVRADFVSVCTPPNLHLEVAKACLEAGFHVMCEKPMTRNLAEAEELAACVARTRRVFGIMHPYVGYPVVKLARDLVARGDLGRVERVVVQYPQGSYRRVDWTKPITRRLKWQRDPRQHGVSGCMSDIGVHAANLLEYVSGLKIREASATLGGEEGGASARVRVEPGENTLLDNRTISRRALNTVVNARLLELFTVIRERLEEMDLVHRLHAGVVLTGGGSRMRNVDMLAEQAFGASVRLGRPIHVDGLEEDPQSPSYAAIAGALLYAHRNYEEKSILDGLLGRFFGK